MKKLIPALLFFSFIAFGLTGTAQKKMPGKRAAAYVPADRQLYDTIVYLDSVLFQAYNTCNVEKFQSFFTDDIEFYHDKGGLTTTKKELEDALRKNICGKVTRELVKGSIEVYPVPNYGAIETGSHGFHNNQEKGTPMKIAKFLHIWQKKDEKWIITRVVSYDH